MLALVSSNYVDARCSYATVINLISNTSNRGRLLVRATGALGQA